MEIRNIAVATVFNETLFAKLGPLVGSLEFLSKPSNWVGWNNFVVILDSLIEHVFPGASQKNDFIEFSLSNPSRWVKPFSPIIATIFRPKTLYRMMSWAGHINFKNIHPSYLEIDDDTVEIQLTLREEDEVFAPYFNMTKHFLSRLPQMIGFEDAKVALSMHGRSGRYVITLPKKKKVFFRLGYFLRFFSNRKEFEASLNDYETSRDELLTSQNMLSVILENSPDSIMLVDRQSTITYINKVAKGIGVNVIGKKAIDFVSERYRAHYLDALDKAYEKNEKNEFELQAIHDSTIWLSTIIPVNLPKVGKLAMVIARDITTQKKVAAGLVEAKNEALKASSAKDVFLANISHEVRTPLTAIIGFAEILEKSHLDAGSKKQVQIINKNGQHLLHLINNILDLSIITADQPKILKRSFSPEDLLNQIIETHKIEAEDKLNKVKKIVDPDTPKMVLADSTHMIQIISNVLSNAVKFTASGTISIEMRCVDSSLVFLVADTGNGIPSEFHEAIFEPFKQADMTSSRKYGGSGLGLAIARKLARAHGGDVVLKRSAPDAGSMFEITMPFESDKSGKNKEPVKTFVSTIDFRGTNMLIVEDHPDIARLLQVYLESANATVWLARDGTECLALNNLNDIQIIIMDIQMPHKDGYETMRELKSRNFHGKIIAVSAHANGSEKKKCLDSGFDGFVSKPINVTTLYNSIDFALRG